MCVVSHNRLKILFSPLIPPGLLVDRVAPTSERITIATTSRTATAACRRHAGGGQAHHRRTQGVM